MSAVEDRLADLGLTVPDVAPPVAAYVPALRDGRPRLHLRPAADGRRRARRRPARSAHGEGHVVPDDAKALAQICALNAIAAVKSVVGDLDKVTRVVKVVGFVASDPAFTGQPGVINGASELLGKAFGEAGVHARSAVGVAVAAAGRTGRGRDRRHGRRRVTPPMPTVFRGVPSA